MIQDRGGKIVNSWQTNFGGNTDFLNMTSENRLKSKKISKTQSISSLLPDNNNYIYAGPNGFIQCLSDNKISYMRIDFKIFGDVDCHLDIKLDVEDSPNSSGVIIDAIRIVKTAIDRGIGGVLIGPSAWIMKHPIKQFDDNTARQMTEDFINENARITMT
jgi:myo-inositol-1-phosphate synthase